MTGDRKSANQRYYQQHREALCAAMREANREKYHNNEEYRQQKIDSAKQRYHAKKVKKQVPRALFSGAKTVVFE